MVNSLLDDVNELLRLSYGEENRLQDIKRRLEDGLTVYNSDINYLKKLVEQHKDETQETAESESTTTEPEPISEPISEPIPEPEIKPVPKKKSSKKKKVGIAFGVIILSFFVLIAIGSSMVKEPTSISPTVIEERNKNLMYEMSDSELSSMAVDWNYKDMLRNPENYRGEIIFVDGTVFNTQRDIDLLTLYVNCEYGNRVICDSDRMFVDVNGINTWLEDDQLSGFVKVSKLSEVGRLSPTTGEFVGSGDYIPRTNEIKLTCSNC